MLSVVPLSRPLDSFWTSFVLFDFILFFLFDYRFLLVSFTPTYVFSYFWLKINSILSVSSCVTSYSFEMDIENKFYICSPCIASFCFLVYFFSFSFSLSVHFLQPLPMLEKCWESKPTTSSHPLTFFFFYPVVQLSRVSVWALCGGLKIQVCQTAGGGCDMRPESLQVFFFWFFLIIIPTQFCSSPIKCGWGENLHTHRSVWHKLVC